MPTNTPAGPGSTTGIPSNSFLLPPTVLCLVGRCPFGLVRATPRPRMWSPTSRPTKSVTTCRSTDRSGCCACRTARKADISRTQITAPGPAVSSLTPPGHGVAPSCPSSPGPHNSPGHSCTPPINAPGSPRLPVVPFSPGAAPFTGTQLHTTDYRSSDQFRGARVLVVGGGNSGAQIAADLLPTASAVTWVTRRPPRFLPDEIDGRALFQLATRHVQGTDDTENPGGIAALGDIVVTPHIRHAREAELVTPTPPVV